MPTTDTLPQSNHGLPLSTTGPGLPAPKAFPKQLIQSAPPQAAASSAAPPAAPPGIHQGKAPTATAKPMPQPFLGKQQGPWMQPLIPRPNPPFTPPGITTASPTPRAQDRTPAAATTQQASQHSTGGGSQAQLPHPQHQGGPQAAQPEPTQQAVSTNAPGPHFSPCTRHLGTSTHDHPRDCPECVRFWRQFPEAPTEATPDAMAHAAELISTGRVQPPALAAPAPAAVRVIAAVARASATGATPAPPTDALPTFTLRAEGAVTKPWQAGQPLLAQYAANVQWATDARLTADWPVLSQLVLWYTGPRGEDVTTDGHQVVLPTARLVKIVRIMDGPANFMVRLLDREPDTPPDTPLMDWVVDCTMMFIHDWRALNLQHRHYYQLNYTQPMIDEGAETRENSKKWNRVALEQAEEDQHQSQAAPSSPAPTHQPATPARTEVTGTPTSPYPATPDFQADFGSSHHPSPSTPHDDAPHPQAASSTHAPHNHFESGYELELRRGRDDRKRSRSRTGAPPQQARQTSRTRQQTTAGVASATTHWAPGSARDRGRTVPVRQPTHQLTHQPPSGRRKVERLFPKLDLDWYNNADGFSTHLTDKGTVAMTKFHAQLTSPEDWDSTGLRPRRIHLWFVDPNCDRTAFGRTIARIANEWGLGVTGISFNVHAMQVYEDPRRHTGFAHVSFLRLGSAQAACEALHRNPLLNTFATPGTGPIQAESCKDSEGHPGAWKREQLHHT